MLLIPKSLPVVSLLTLGSCLFGSPSAIASGNSESVGASEALVEQLVAESQKLARERRVSADDPIYAAEKACHFLAGDISELKLQYRRIIEAYGKKGDLVNAEHVANESLKLGDPVGSALVAAAHARKGNEDEALAWAETALANLIRVTGLDKDTLHMECARTYRLLGKEGRVAKMVAELPEHLEWVINAEGYRSGALAPDIMAIEELQSRVEKSGVGVVEAGKWLLAQGTHELKHGQRDLVRGAEILRLSIEVCSNSKNVKSHHLLLEIAELAAETGLSEITDEAMKRFVGLSRGYASEADWKPGYLFDAASFYRGQGNEKMAGELFQEALTSLESVSLVELSGGMAAAIIQFLKLGKPDRALDFALSALKFGAAHDHPRIKGRAVVDVCLAYGEGDKILPEEIAKEIARIEEQGS